MKRNVITWILFLIATIMTSRPAWADDADLKKLFSECQVEGTMILSSLDGGTEYVFNSTRSEVRYTPASTFKIPNTLIALDEGAIADEKETIPWNGEDKGWSVWNRDQCLETAFPMSCVWFYQELAKRVGDEKYMNHFERIDYGNKRTGSMVSTFWLSGDLRISAREQIDFLKKLYKGELPYKKEHLQLLKRIMVVEEAPQYCIRAKTGWAMRIEDQIGWYVGYIETGSEAWFFATNIDIEKKSDAAFRKELTMRALEAKGLLSKVRWPCTVDSNDGTPIAFEVHGASDPTLVFVHGWSCDSRYWRAQVPHFAKKQHVVTVDLAGHGHSGLERREYTMKAFGEDVKAVVDAVGSDDVVLIGHSMGGAVIAYAARLMPKRVKGLIGIDTLQNIEYPVTEESLKEMMAPLKEDFRTGGRQFAKQMLRPETDPKLLKWVMNDMSAAPPAVALSALKHHMGQYISGEGVTIFEEIPIPVVVINGDMWPIDHEANRRHMFSFDAIVLKDADHFLMMNRPDEFNRALEEVIDKIMAEDEK